MMDRDCSITRFVTNLDAASSPRFTLYRDFIDAVSSNHPNDQSESDSINPPENPISNDEFKKVIDKVLTTTQLFTTEEIQCVIHEFEQGNLCHNASSQAHLFARSIGLPNLEFALKVKKTTFEKIQSNHPESSSPLPKVKGYPFSLTPEFYVTLLEEVPILKHDFDDNIYNKISTLYAKTAIPPKRQGMTSAEKQLRVIKANTINIARALERPAEIVSLQSYARQTVFRERVIGTKTMNELTKKNLFARKPTPTKHFNCFRYSAYNT